MGVQSKVEAGAAFLDQAVPGWETQMRLTRLDVADTWNCVLAQLFGTYGRGKRKLGLTKREAVRLGFDSHAWRLPFRYGAYFDKLNDEWGYQITSRRLERAEREIARDRELVH